MVAGALAIIVAYLLDTTVGNYEASVVNLGLLQRQIIVLHSGIGALIAGAVLAGCGSILEQLRSQSMVASEPVALEPASLDVQIDEAKEALRRDIAFNKLFAGLCGLLVIVIGVIYFFSR